MDYKRNFKFQISNFKFVRGLTLPEILIGLVLIAIIASLITTIFMAHLRLFTTQDTTIKVSSQNKLALDEITNEMRESQAVVDTCTGCGGDTTSANVLVLQLWRLDTNGDPSDTAFDYIVYKRDPTDNTKLLKKVIPDATSTRPSSQKIIATNLSTDANGLKFEYDDNNHPTTTTQITVTITTTGISDKKTITNTQSTKVMLRNK